MSVREVIQDIQRIIADTIADLQSGNADHIQASLRLAILQSNLRRLKAETIEL